MRRMTRVDPLQGQWSPDPYIVKMCENENFLRLSKLNPSKYYKYSSTNISSVCFNHSTRITFCPVYAYTVSNQFHKFYLKFQFPHPHPHLISNVPHTYSYPYGNSLSIYLRLAHRSFHSSEQQNILKVTRQDQLIFLL